MSNSYINGNVTIGVTLGVAGYGSNLMLSSKGTIVPIAHGSDGVYATAGSIVNYGSIAGRAGGDNGGAGVGILDGSLLNAGTIAGGSCSANGTMNTGGAGVELDGATVSNTGLIVGGSSNATSRYYDQYVGGVGVSESSGAMTNTGTVMGGGKQPHGLGADGGDGTDISGGSFINEGLIVGGYGQGKGAEIDDGTITNDGVISGGIEAVGVKLVSGTVINDGVIAGGNHYAYLFQARGLDGVDQFGGTLVNNGLITGSNAKVLVVEGATNAIAGYGVYQRYGIILNYGTISAGAGGVDNCDPYYDGDVGVSLENGTLVTGGLIAGGVDGLGNLDDAVRLHSSLAVMIIDPGAAFKGSVAGVGGNQLQLDAGTTSSGGTLDMGGTFSGFGTIGFGAGADWQVEGTAGELASGQTISGFTFRDTIFLQGFAATSETFIPGSGLELSNGLATEMLDITGDFSTASFAVAANGGQTEVELLCYLRGTRILTPAGEVAVEHLCLGDSVVTRFGGYRKIKWIGRQSFSAQFVRNNLDQVPVRISAGALGSGVPKRDLFVSPGHSMLLGGVLVLASTLVNDATITQAEIPDEIHYYQVEFDTHDCVVAEGSWSESFCDYGGLRNQFHNVSQFWDLYPNHVTPDKHLMCASRPENGPALEAALRPVVARATERVQPGPLRGVIDELQPSGLIRGWAFDEMHPALPVLLEVLLHGRVVTSFLACDYRSDLLAAGFGRGRCAFTIRGPKIAYKSLPYIRIRRGGKCDELPFAPHFRQTGTASETLLRRA